MAAVSEYALKLDGANIDAGNAAVTAQEFSAAEKSISGEERAAMLQMKQSIESFARKQKSSLANVVQKSNEGATSLVFRPIERLGIYVPAGRAPLFSSLFMAAVPSAVAGVKDIVVCTPPQKDGNANARIIAAAEMCGISRVCKIGGAQAIAAMAYGLDGVLQPVDLVCGPGNAYVNAAKQIVAGQGTRIDVPAGPSEVLVIADKSANAAFVAADMLAQAEHGVDSAAVCICTDEGIAGKIALEVQRQLALLPSGTPARQSIEKWGRIWLAGSVADAISAANTLACEHLELMVGDAEKYVPNIQNAGAVFVKTAEAFCDYGMSGGNHILPTGAAARSFSGVSLQTFGKWMYVDLLVSAAQEKLAKRTALLARMEGLEAHARAAEIRGKKL